MRPGSTPFFAAAAGALLAVASVSAQDGSLILERAYDQHPNPRDTDNPTDADHALALYRDDEWNRALVCPEQRAATQPADRHLIRCEFTQVATLATGPVPLTVALSRTHYEHDGMYGSNEDVVVLAHGSTESVVVATITQLDVDVVDARSTFRMRRQRVVDLDRDGDNDMCIESVEEEGPGLFAVLDLHGRAFRPNRRSRGIDAWSVDRAARLVRRETLDERCPARGYRPFVATTSRSADPVERRREVQGRFGR